MDWPLDRERLSKMDEKGIPRYESIAKAIEQAIVTGQLRSGERLSTVRQLAEQLGVSGTTIAAAYNLLSKRGWIRSEVGRGTFITSPQIGGGFSNGAKRPSGASPPATSVHGGDIFQNVRPSVSAAPWRRRSLMSSAMRLRAAYPGLTDCSTGRPDPDLLPLEVLRCAWKQAVESTVHADLQYAGPEPTESLTHQLLPRLNADHVPVRAGELVIGSSAQQLMVLTLQVIAAASGNSGATIAVENPGYPTIFDTYERGGYRLTGIDVDAFGAVPASLDAALREGATAVLLTPRAHNPTGASWSVERAAALADVIAAHPGVVVMEDDHFAGIATARPGSLLSDPRNEDRIVYIRSFSKSLAPDLRIAVAAVRARLRSLLNEAKTFADGWTSRITQRTLACALARPELDSLLAAATRAYAERRTVAARQLHALLAPLGGSAWSGADGVNIWVHLPSGLDALQVIEQAASLGVLVAPGEPFFIRPGRGDVLRINAGAVSADRAADIGGIVAKAALTQAETTVHAIPV